MTVLTDEEQARLRTIGITGMSTHRASLARIVGVYLDGHACVQEGFVGNHALQQRKIGERTNVLPSSKAPNKERPFLPRINDRGILARFGEYCFPIITNTQDFEYH